MTESRAPSDTPRWETVVGIEAHLQLRTRTKAFCGCEVAFGGEPNTRVCPVCLGLPGALPTVNGAAVTFALRVAAALGCRLPERSRFDRKNYFYPDLPKGYQISQFDRPFGEHGELEVPGDDDRPSRRLRIRRVHMEEDTGKLVHDASPDKSLLDLNRAGTPLVEIVSEPDLRDPDEVFAALRQLHLTLAWLDVSDCDMEKGSFRCEPNVSVRPVGTETLGTKTELKNLNSFRHARDAVRYEAARQIELLESGGRVLSETRLWDPDRRVTARMRAKEEAHDYRYFPDPDLPPLTFDPAALEAVRAALPEAPPARTERYRRELGLSDYDARTLVADPDLARWFEAASDDVGDAKSLANWILGDIARERNERGLALERFPFAPAALAELVDLVDGGAVSRRSAREVLAVMIETGEPPRPIIDERGLAKIGSADDLAPIVEEAMAESPRAVADLRAGNDKASGAILGAVMKKTRGKADPAVVHRILRERL